VIVTGQQTGSARGAIEECRIRRRGKILKRLVDIANMDLRHEHRWPRAALIAAPP
jgi:hypothetical protein